MAVSRFYTMCEKRHGFMAPIGRPRWLCWGGRCCAHCDGDVIFAVIAARDRTWEYGAIHNWRDKCYSGMGGVDSPMVALGGPGLAGDGTGVGSTSVDAGVRRRLGWMRGGWRAVGGSQEGEGAVCWWLGAEMVGWKVINQWTTKQRSATDSTPQQPSTGHPQPPSQ